MALSGEIDRWKVSALVGSLLLMQALGTMSFLAPSILIVAAAPDLGISENAIGVYVAFVFSASAVGALLAGRALDRLGAPRLAQVSLVLNAIGTALTASAVLMLTLVGALVIGFAYGFSTPASTELIARHTPERRRALLFSIRQTGVPMGGVLTGLLMPWLLVRIGWQASLLAVAAASLAGALVFVYWKGVLGTGSGAGARAQAPLLKPLVVVLQDARLRAVGLASVAFGFVQWSFAGYFVLALVGYGGRSLHEAGIVLAISQGSAIVGRIFWGWMADRIGSASRVMVFLALAAALACLAMYALGPGWPFAVLGLLGILVGASTSGWNGVFVAEIVRLAPPQMAGSVTGGVLVLAYLGSLVGPTLFAGMLGLLGSLPLTFAALAAVALAPVVLLGRDQKPKA